MRSHLEIGRSCFPTLVALALGAALAACGDSGTGPPPDGEMLWSIAAPGVGEPAADANAVYFGAMQSEVVAVDRATGEIRWRSGTETGLPPRQRLVSHLRWLDERPSVRTAYAVRTH